jgi:signal transduction histidine kinase/CheY-like chemotaxis protein
MPHPDHPMKARALLAVAPLLLCSLLLAQPDGGAPPAESGLPRMAIHPPHAYNGHNQVFQSVQGANGVIYITNYGAILTWDGERWGRIPVPGAGFLYGIASMGDNRFAVCGVNTIGLIEPDGEGGWAWRSLVEDLPAAEREELGEIWDMAATPDGLYFFTRRSMFRWTGEAVRVWHFETEKMIYGFWSGSAVYVQNLDDGLYRLDGDELTRLSEAPLFRNPGPRLILDHEDGALLVATMQEGLWVYDDGQLAPHAPEASAYLSGAVMNRGARLADGALALGTFQGGLVIVDPRGNFDRLIDEASGLPSNIVTHVSQDREGGLWVSLASGIARVEADGRITRYDRSLGLPNVTVSGILRHRGDIYLSSANGLYRLRAVAPPARPQWEQVPGTSSEVHAMIPHGDDLFAATKGQVIRYDGSASEVVWDDYGLLRAMHRLRQPQDHILVGGRIGLGLIYREDGEWQTAGPLPQLEDHVYSIAEDADGDIWLGTVFSGVIRIRGAGTGAGWIEGARIERYGLESGLSAMEHVKVRFQDGRVTALTPTGPQYLDEATGRFVDLEGEGTRKAPPPDGWAWDVVVRNNQLGAWGSVYPLEGAEDDFSLYFGGRTPDGEWTWISPEVFDDIGGLLYLYIEEGDPPVLWAGGWSGLLRWELVDGVSELKTPILEAMVREIRLPSGETACSGAEAAGGFSFPHSRGGLTFQYAAPLHTPGVRVTYRSRLEGYETDWTAWSGAAERTFTNLPGGSYRFQVEARTPSGLSAPTSAAAFTVLPPWYQTRLAYAGYAALAGLLFWGGARLRLAALRRDNRRLEGMVAARTSELAESERELRKARDAADHANKQKSRFLANMSHELRTPLNAIMGYAQILDRDPQLDERNRQRVGILNTSCNLLVHLINEVLDLSKIEAGRLELNESAVHLERPVRAVVESFGARAAQKRLSLELVAGPSLPEWVLVDVRKVEQILGNLVGNALKFTREGGVRVELGAEGPEIRIDVVDTGVGIPEDQLEAVFDAFHQTGEQPGREAGTGLGLAISRRLAEVMGGGLECTSRVGEGSRFRLRLPLKPADRATAAPGDGDRRVAGYAGGRRTVLVVDDVAANRDIVVELLSPLGFEVATSASGADALARVAAGGVDAVLLDLRMAPMDGAEVLRGIRRTRAGEQLPVIAYSASLIGFTRKEALEMGCDDWLPKPFTPEDLFAKLGRLLNLQWEYRQAAAAAAPAGAYRFRREDLEALRALAYRREPVGLKTALEAIRDREPASAGTVAPMLALAARFRLGEVSGQLETMEARVEPS